VGKYPFLQPLEKGISADADHLANLGCPVIGLIINNHRHFFLS
jgi:hypothetical protein